MTAGRGVDQRAIAGRQRRSQFKPRDQMLDERDEELVGGETT